MIEGLSRENEVDRRHFIGRCAASIGAIAALGPSVAYGQVRRPMRDVVVLLPGIMGSVLRKDQNDVWALSGSALLAGIRSRGASVRDLVLNGDSADAESLGDGVTPSRIFPDTHLLPGLWKVDGYSALSKSLLDEFDLRLGENYFEFPYDWRRDNRAAARRLARLAPGWLKNWRARSSNREARLLLIAHSMGGLVARYYLEVLGGWREARRLITFGTPFRGSVKALGALANGLQGPRSLVDLSMLVRSFTSVYQLLPIYPCYSTDRGQLVRPVDAVDIPNLDQRRVKEAFAFHEEIRQANEQNSRDGRYLSSRYTIHPIVGTFQPTLQAARKRGAVLEMSEQHPSVNLSGDGTVPQASARPIESQQLSQQHQTVYVAETHASIQNAVPVLNHIRAVLAEETISDALFREPRSNAVGLRVNDAYADNYSVSVGVRSTDPGVAVIEVMSADKGQQVKRIVLDVPRNDETPVDCGRLPEGVYRVRVRIDGGASATDLFMVAGS
jgi:hypothetical protein